MEQLVKINNASVSIREHSGKRVITLSDVDKAHNRSNGTARRNFNDNKKRFIEGVDCFVRNSYEAKKEYGITAPNGVVLLTESGYLMLAKSFTDDLAWKVQRELVNNYFRPQVQPEPECEQLTLETSEYHYFNKTYKGQPVLGTTDIEHLAGISSKSIGWYIREKGFINGVDYFLLNGQQMADFKAENPMVSRLTVEMYVITKSGFEKLMKLSGRRCEKPKCFIEQKKTAPAPQKWVTADECITALNVLSWIKDYCTHEVEENKAKGDKMASRYEKTLSACNDIIKQVGMMIAAS